MRKYFFFISFLYCFNVFSQNSSELFRANLLYSIADSLSQNSKYVDSNKRFYEAAEIFKKHKSWSKYYRSLNNVASNFFVLKKTEKTLEICFDIIKNSKLNLGKNNSEEALANYHIGYSLAFEKGKPDEAKKHLLIAEAIQITLDPKDYVYDLIKTKIALGRIYDLKNDNELALKYFQYSLNLGQKYFGDDHLNLRRSLDFIGRLLVKQGNYERGLEYFLKELNINEKNYGKNHVKVAGSYIKLGITNRFMGKYNEALDKNLKALEIYKNKLGSENLHVAVALNNIGFTLDHKGDYEKALTYHRRSLKLFEKLVGKENPRVAISYNNLGLVYFHQKKYDLALVNHKKALKIRKKSLNIHHPYITLSHNHLGDVYLAKEEYQKALISYQKAIYNNVSNFNENLNIYANPKLNSALFDQMFLLNSLKGKAFALSKMPNLKDLLFSEETYRLCDNLIFKIRISLQKQSDKVELNNSINEIYKNAVNVCYKLFEATNDEIYLEKAFTFAEKNKASILSGTISEINAKQFSGISDSLLIKEKNIKNEIAYNLQKIASRPDSLSEIKYRNELFSLNSDLEELINNYDKYFPKYHALKFRNVTPSINDIQKTLDYNTSIVEYFTDDNVIYAFVISKNNFYTKKINIEYNIKDGINKMIENLKNDNINEYSKHSFELFNQLIKPINPKTSNLIIIPDNYLWKLNFDILISEAPKENDYRALNYLIKNYSINYANSAKLLLQNLKVKSKHVKNETLAFSYDNNDLSNKGNYINMQLFRNANLSELPGTRKEIKAISEVMEGDYFYGASANEKNFKANAKNYNILHLALHGTIDNSNPLNSKLYFTQNTANPNEVSQDNDNIEDNYLHIFELYNLELNSELVVLSACNTGKGKIVKGEGIMSLGRAFTYAGCKSIILSQWEVSDAFTPEIMNLFYKNLKEGNNKSNSLRKAKLAYLANANKDTSNPYFWAPLVQIGNNQPLNTSNYIYKIIYGLTSLVIMGMLTYGSFRIRKITT